MGRSVCDPNPQRGGGALIFKQTPLAGLYVVEPEILTDDRGLFARTYCEREFSSQGLSLRIVQCNVSSNRLKGTLRGLHYQKDPHGEVKLVTCTRGAIYDVAVDLRRASPTFAKWFGIVLSAENRLMLYVPEGFAHGFQTITDDVELFYQMSQFYVSEAAAGVRWNDPQIGLKWPFPDPILSPRDRSLPLLDDLSDL